MFWRGSLARWQTMAVMLIVGAALFLLERYPLWQSTFLSFGFEYNPQNTVNHYKFTGKERDSESNLDYFGARYYSSNQGRWLSPDWSGAPEAVPYADLADPQTLNLYGYVRNNPLSRSDVDGHCCDFSDVSDFSTAAVNAWASDNLAGAGRQDQTTDAGRIGAAVGDAVATVQGTGEVLFGGGLELGGTLADATGAGAVVGVPANVVGAAALVHGGIAATTGFDNLLRSASESSAGSQTPATEPYQRPSGATTPEQRTAVQGKPCVDCGKTGPKMVANHKTPLVKEHYQTGSIDKARMRSLDAVNTHCPSCSASSGGRLSKFGKQMKKVVQHQ